MTRPIYNFGKTFYEVEDAPLTWTQSDRRFPDGYAMDRVECSTCKEDITYIFPARDSALARHASHYMQPTAVRCGCFFDKPDVSSWPTRPKLKKEPLRITPLS
jgi:hypothetical protein